jgi:MFS family permease
VSAPDAPRDFRRLWAGQTVSLVGDQVSAFVLPTVAVVVLHASSAQVGVLNAIASAAHPVLGLFVGVLMDRIRRRPAMIVADLVRCVAFATLPAAAALDALSLAQLYAVAAVTGVFSVLFDVAYQSYLPTLLAGEPLARGNARLEMSSSVSRLTGPMLGGVLLQGLAAVGALAANALSFLASATGVAPIRTPEPGPSAHPGHTGVWRPILEGLHFLWRHPLLRPAHPGGRLRNLGMSAVRTILLLFLYRALSLSPGVAGTVFTAGAAAAVAGATLSGWLTRRLGVGCTLLLTGCEGLAWPAVPLALTLPPVATMATIMIASSLWLPIWNAVVTTLRQQVRRTPTAGPGARLRPDHQPEHHPSRSPGRRRPRPTPGPHLRRARRPGARPRPQRRGRRPVPSRPAGREDPPHPPVPGPRVGLRHRTARRQPDDERSLTCAAASSGAPPSTPGKRTGSPA